MGSACRGWRVVRLRLTTQREVLHAFRVARVHRMYATEEAKGSGGGSGELLGVVTLRDAIGRFLVRQEEEKGEERRGEGKEEPVRPRRLGRMGSACRGEGSGGKVTEWGGQGTCHLSPALREVLPLHVFRVMSVHRIYVTQHIP
ncbi:hypothetical protein CLOP_g5886 [Closterium sp. NIES-67]|nr:hypothetical protein CLOP_g5886 [Closterium sp. NIES-67]